MDFVWTRGKRAVGIEVKAGPTWRREDGTALRGLVEDGALTEGHGVYTGTAVLKVGPIRVWPVMRFLRELNTGHLLG